MTCSTTAYEAIAKGVDAAGDAETQSRSTAERAPGPRSEGGIERVEGGKESWVIVVGAELY